MLSKSLIQFSVDGWGCVPSLLFDLRPNYGVVNEDNFTGVTLRRYPKSKGKDGRRGKIVKSHLESNPIPARDAQRAKNKPWVR